MNDKIRESLDGSMADFSWKEKHRNNVMNRVRNTSRPVRPLKATLAIGFALLMVLCIATAMAGAFSESFNGWLYERWPELATSLMPVNLAYEDQGFRMEVVSAVDKGSEALIVYTMQDLEGDRLKNTFPYADLYSAEGYPLSSDGSILSDYNPETRKGTYAQYLEYADGCRPVSGSVTYSVPQIEPYDRKDVDLMPYYIKYGSQVQAATAPENVYIQGPYHDSVLPDSTRIIDWHNSLELPLSDSVSLSGIGMIDGCLHVQIHYTDRTPIVSEPGYVIYPYHAWIHLYNAGFDYLYTADDGPGGISVLQWGGDEFDAAEGAGTPEWEEFFFKVDPEAVDRVEHFFVSITKALTPITGNWKVDIPVRLIRK